MELIRVIDKERLLEIIDGPLDRNLLRAIKIYSDSGCAIRDEVEYDTSVVQLVAGAIIRTPEGVVAYKRAGSERRLRGSWSIIFGGHVQCNEWYEYTLQREFKEELLFAPIQEKLIYFGTLYLPSNEVSEVHVGVLYIYNMPEFPKKHGSEIETLEVVSNQPFEAWSEYILKEGGMADV